MHINEDAVLSSETNVCRTTPKLAIDFVTAIYLCEDLETPGGSRRLQKSLGEV